MSIETTALGTNGKKDVAELAAEILQRELDKGKPEETTRTAEKLKQEAERLADLLPVPEEYRPLIDAAAFFKYLCRTLRAEILATSGNEYRELLATYCDAERCHVDILRALGSAALLARTADDINELGGAGNDA